MIRVCQVSSTEGLRDLRIERKQNAAPEHGSRVEDHSAQADAANRLSAVGHVPNHDGVHQTHGHPSDLCQDKRPCQREDAADLRSHLPDKLHRHTFDVPLECKACACMLVETQHAASLPCSLWHCHSEA